MRVPFFSVWLAVLPIGCATSHETGATGSLACLIPAGSSCPGEPPVTPLRFQRTIDSLNAVHWHLTEECIPVTYDPELEPIAPEIVRAVSLWSSSSIGCSQLCFAVPVSSADLGECARSLHFAAVFPPDLPESTLSFANILYDEQDGSIIRATVAADFDRVRDDGPSLQRVLVHSVGLATGLMAARHGTESALDHVATSILAPTSIDEAAICAVYGADPYCQ